MNAPVRAAALAALGLGLAAAALAASPQAAPPSGIRVFDVRAYGATGRKADSAQAAIQKAVDACAAAGGGMVYVPPGDYSTGTIHLRSHVRLFVEAGATVWSIKKKEAFDKEALLFADGAENITIEGRGVFNGEGAYEWRPRGDFRDDFIRPNQVEMEKRGLPLLRSFPRTDQFGKLVLLLRCRDVRIAGVSFIDSPQWTMHLYGCERTVIDGIFISSSLKSGVWADGIDPDGCRDLRISNCTIATGDDALVFYSMDWFGPALPCENITVTNCRLTSASSALKFCDGNMNAVRNVTVDNCVLTGANRGIAIMNFDGGVVENVVLSNLVVDCVRFDWFWWGDGDPFHMNLVRRHEITPEWPPEKRRPAGVIRDVKIQNVVARGYGSSVCNGHPDSWLDGVSMENVKLTVAHDPKTPYDKAVHALTFERARNLRLRDVEVAWEAPAFDQWRSGFLFRDVRDLVLDGLKGAAAPSAAEDVPAVAFDRVAGAVVRDCRAAEGGTFLGVAGKESRDILLTGNDLDRAKRAVALGPEVAAGAVRIK